MDQADKKATTRGADVKTQRNDQVVKERVTRERLVHDLRALFPGAIELLALHSSLSSLGQVHGGATTVVDALLRVLGPSGTLLVPAFTYSFSSIGKWPPFDYEKTPSLVGSITEAVRLHPQAVRSFHPTHSVAVIGPRALHLTRGHLASTPLGAGSPFHRLAAWGGEVMLMGCDHRSNSLLHVAEALAGVPYGKVPFSEGQDFETAVVYRGGRPVVELKLYEVPGCSRGFHKAEPVLREAGVIREGQVGQAQVQVFSAKALLDVMVARLKKDPALLLCDVEDCSICPRRRQALR